MTKNILSGQVTVSESLYLATIQRHMVQVQWKNHSSYEAAFPLMIFEHNNQEYLIWQRPTEGILDCSPLSLIQEISPSSQHFLSSWRIDDLYAFQQEWLYFEQDHVVKKPDFKASLEHRMIIKIHAPLLQVDLEPLQSHWKKFVIVGTTHDELIMAGNGVIDDRLFAALAKIRIKISFLSPEWVQPIFRKWVRKNILK